MKPGHAGFALCPKCLAPFAYQTFLSLSSKLTYSDGMIWSFWAPPTPGMCRRCGAAFFLREAWRLLPGGPLGIPGKAGHSARKRFPLLVATAEAIDRRLARSRFVVEQEVLWRLRRLQRANDPLRNDLNERWDVLVEACEWNVPEERPSTWMPIDDGVRENAARLLALTDRLADWSVVEAGGWEDRPRTRGFISELELVWARVLALAQLGRLDEAGRLEHLDESVGVIVQALRGPDDRLRLSIIHD